jgi:hypothetical protein
MCSFKILLLIRYFLGDQRDKDEMSETCGNMVKKKNTYRDLEEEPEGKGRFEDQGLEGRTITK